MKRKPSNSPRNPSPKASAGQVRATISFPPEVYQSLEQIAKEKKVSLAWVVRDAAEKYLSDRWPLFAQTERISQLS